jgi:hypothetical protein
MFDWDRRGHVMDAGRRFTKLAEPPRIWYRRGCPFRRSIVMLAVVLAVASSSPVSFRSAPAQAAVRCSGVHLRPGANIQRAIVSHARRTTFCLADGRYTTRTALKPKNGDRFIGVYTDRSRPKISNTGTGGVFSGGRNVVIRGLGIGPSDNTGLNPGTGSTIIGNRIHDNRMCGIETAANHLTIRRNEIDHNGSLATKGDACGIKLHGTAGKDSGAYSLVSANLVHNNTGHGLWVDCDGHDNTFSGNRVYGNAGVALDDETSYNNSFTDNIVYGNGFGWSTYATSILDSIGTNVSGNRFRHNYKGVDVRADDRATRSRPRPGLGCANITLTGYHPSGISIRRNKFSLPQRSGFASTVRLSAARFDHNCWRRTEASSTNWRLPTDATATWSQWREAQQDQHGRLQALPC